MMGRQYEPVEKTLVMPRAGNISRLEREKTLMSANGLCSFPGCTVDLADYMFDHGMVAKISHIHSSADNGPRAKPELSEAERNAYENLILLCDEHARAIDVMPVTTYTAECLREMKNQHEARCATARNAGTTWTGLLGEPNYINLSRLFLDAAPDLYASGDVNTRTLPSRTWQEMSQEEYFHYQNLARRNVSRIERSARRLTRRQDLADSIGSRFLFWRRIRTKGVYDASGRPRPITGDYDRDPQVYMNVDGYRIVMPIDTKWITSTTAAGLFRSGTTSWTGIATLRRVEVAKAIMSPIVLAMPAEDAVMNWHDLRSPWFHRLPESMPPIVDDLEYEDEEVHAAERGTIQGNTEKLMPL